MYESVVILFLLKTAIYSLAVAKNNAFGSPFFYLLYVPFTAFYKRL